MKTRSGKLVVVGLVLIAVSVAGNAILYAFGASPFNAVSYEDRRSLPANGVTRVTIHSAVGDVRVVPGEDAIVAKVAGTAGRLERNGVRLTAAVRDGRAVIEAVPEKRFRFVSIHPGRYELVVELPGRLFERVDIETLAADISAEGIRARTVTMRTEYGNIDASGLSGGIRAQAAAGDIRLKMPAIRDDIAAETRHGNIELVTGEAPEKLALDVKAVVGRETVDLPGTAIGDGSPSVVLRADVGDIAVRLSPSDP